MKRYFVLVMVLMLAVLVGLIFVRTTKKVENQKPINNVLATPTIVTQESRDRIFLGEIDGKLAVFQSNVNGGPYFPTFAIASISR